MIRNVEIKKLGLFTLKKIIWKEYAVKYVPKSNKK